MKNGEENLNISLKCIGELKKIRKIRKNGGRGIIKIVNDHYLLI
jgi:hypothetical protein